MTIYPKNRKAFTLSELMITVIILGVIASFGIPSYTKSVNRSREKDALFNLELIREAVKLYMVRVDGPMALGLRDVNAINATLNINIMEQAGNTYDCKMGVGGYTCQAVNADGWSLSFELDNNNGEVYCSAGPCPSL